MASELIDRRRIRIGPKAWRVSETYKVPWADAEAEESALWDRQPEGFDGRSQPVCVEVRTVRAPVGRAALAYLYLVATYDTLTWDDWLVYNPNHLLLDTKGGVTTERVTKDLDGNIIEGVDTDDTAGLSKWVIEKGTNTLFRPKVTYIAHGLVNSRTYIDPYTEKLGAISSTSMSKFGKHQASGKLLFTDLASRPHQLEDHHWWVWYYFMGDDTGWDVNCLARKYHSRVYRVPVLDIDDDTEDGGDREVRTWVPSPTETRTATMVNDKSFSLINDMIVWG